MNNNIYSKKNLFYLTILSIAFTVFFFNEQVAVRGGLVISGDVIYHVRIRAYANKMHKNVSQLC